MVLETKKQNDILVIKLAGVNALDAEVSQQFRDEIATHLDEHPKVVINLEGIQFIDSSGLSALVAAYKKAANKGGELKLSCIADPVTSIFEMTRLHRLIEMHGTEEEAVLSYQG